MNKIVGVVSSAIGGPYKIRKQDRGKAEPIVGIAKAVRLIDGDTESQTADAKGVDSEVESE